MMSYFRPEEKEAVYTPFMRENVAHVDSYGLLDERLREAPTPGTSWATFYSSRSRPISPMTFSLRSTSLRWLTASRCGPRSWTRISPSSSPGFRHR